MNYIVPVFAYLSPALLGLIIAFLLNNHAFGQQGWKGLGKLLLYYLTAPLIVIMVIVGFIPSHPPFNLGLVNLLYLTIFLWGWLVMIAGVSCLFIRIGLNKNIAYIIVSLLILLTNATIFYINPFINAWQDNPALRQWIIKTGIAVNPMLTVASNFFRHDLLRSREMYALCDIGPYYFYSYANWFTAWIIYVIIGVLTVTLAVLKKKETAN